MKQKVVQTEMDDDEYVAFAKTAPEDGTRHQRCAETGSPALGPGRIWNRPI